MFKLMEILIKQTIKLGNSAGVILPKNWENKKVRVEIVEDSIINDVFEILKENDLLFDVIGIYLAGSYARGEETPDSDIDLFVITGSINRKIKRGKYDILLISKDKLEKNLKKSLYIYSMVKEARSILNNSLITEYRKNKVKLPLGKILEEIKSVLKINREIIEIDEEMNKPVRDGTAYSVVLRLRELFLIECLLKNKPYTNNNFLKIIEKNNSRDIYEAYLRVKNNSKEKNNLGLPKILNLLEYSKKLIKEIEVKIGKKSKTA